MEFRHYDSVQILKNFYNLRILKNLYMLRQTGKLELVLITI